MTQTNNKKNTTEVHKINHNARKFNDDVNPLIHHSEKIFTSSADNYIVARKKDGTCVLYPEKFHGSILSLIKDKIFNPIIKFYEVDKKKYHFLLTMSLPTSQSTLRFTASFHFELCIKDPRKIVQDHSTSMLSYVFATLLKKSSEESSNFKVDQTKDAKERLQLIFDKLELPQFLEFSPVVVELTPDAAAMEHLKIIEQESIKLQRERSELTLNTAKAMGNEIAQRAPELLEDHHIHKVISSADSTIQKIVQKPSEE